MAELGWKVDDDIAGGRYKLGIPGCGGEGGIEASGDGEGVGGGCVDGEGVEVDGGVDEFEWG